MQHFADRMAAAVKRKKTAVAVGLDPRIEQLPKALLSNVADPMARAAAYRVFCEGVIDAVASLVPVVKPQAAFFEQLGPPGIDALAAVIQHARQAGLIVILDAKRGDIGSTAEAYADAYLAGTSSGMAADALTVNPYLGDDSLTPFVAAAQAHGGGVFVLVKTSNPGGGQFQDLIADGRPVYRHVAEHVASLAADSAGDCGYGLVGAVVGATYPEQLAELRAVMPRAWLLVPGYGSQGGKAKDVAAAFDASGLGALVNNSRGIIFAHSQPRFERFGPARWQDAVAAATREMIAELRAETTCRSL